ncbi:hypothetical protein EIP86_005312 [Pleurotus ostreatoroseus]|nr:hypothetical protein EIP86_005312 [Pleurotus ostreatoroseus]
MAEVINTIRQSFGFDLGVNDEQALRAFNKLRELTQAGLHSLSEELYSKDAHFVLEFVQNADDNAYGSDVKPCLYFTLDSQERTLTIRCNETGFTEEDVWAICNIGKSKKKNQVGYIGEKGIGFKSVFKVADIVHIASNAYRFMLDKRDELGMIVPTWSEQCPAKDGWTVFHLQLSAAVSLPSLAQRLREIQPTLLLFLRKLRRIRITIDGEVAIYTCTPFEDKDTIRVTCKRNGTTQSTDYLLVLEDVETNRDEPKRVGISKSEVVLAFPFTTANKPIVKEQDVHAFLPIRACPLPPDFDWFQFLPRSSSDSFFGGLRQCIIQALTGEPVMLCTEGVYRLPSKLIVLTKVFLDEAGKPLIPTKYLSDKFYLHTGYHACRDAAVFNALGINDLSGALFLTTLEKMHKEGALSIQDNSWLERVSKAILHLFPRPEARDLKRLQELPLVRLADGGICTARRKLYFDAQLTDIPKDLDLQLVVSCGADLQSYRGLLSILGVESADVHQIVELISERHQNTYGSLTKAQLVALPSHARFLFHHAQWHLPKKYSFYVRTSDGHFQTSTSVYVDPARDAAHSGLADFILSAGASVLHADYFVQVSDMETWMGWLHSHVGICLVPRIENGGLSSEFSRFAQTAHTKTFLNTLRRYWTHLASALWENGRRELKEVIVTCEDGSKRKLESTFVKRTELEKVTGLPFLPLSDPESTSWDFLRNFDVSLSLNSLGYLELLKQLSQKGALQAKEDVETLYYHLAALFDHKNASTIRQANFYNVFASWLPKLAKLRILPVRVHETEYAFKSVDDDFLVPDKSGRLAKLFLKDCLFLDLPETFPLSRFQPLLDSPAFHAIKYLEPSVERKVVKTGRKVPQKADAAYMTSRIHHLRRFLNVKATELDKLLSCFRVYRVEEIGMHYHFREFVHNVPVGSDVEINKEEDAIDVYICGDASVHKHLVAISQVLSEYFETMSIEEIISVLSLHPDTLDSFLEVKGIPDISQVEKDDEPDDDEASAAGDLGEVQGHRDSNHDRALQADEQDVQAIIQQKASMILQTDFSQSTSSPHERLQSVSASSPSESPTAIGVDDEPPRLARQDEPSDQQHITGVLGEVFMYKVMKENLRLPSFDEKNWTSARRGKVLGFEDFVGDRYADFKYPDKEGALTKYLLGDDRYKEWKGNWPTYYVEVKSTGGWASSEPFIFRKTQLDRALEMAHTDLTTVPHRLYVLARVWSVQSENPENIKFKMYTNLPQMFRDGSLSIASDVEVAIRD